MTIDDRDSLNVQKKIRSIKAVDVIIDRQSVSRSRDGKIPDNFCGVPDHRPLLSNPDVEVPWQ